MDSQKIFNDQSLSSTKSEIYQLLNFLEVVAIAYLHDIADRQIIDATLRTQLKTNHKRFESFINVIKEDRKRSLWEPYDDLILKWESEK